MWSLIPHHVRCPTHRGWRCIVLAGALSLALPLAGAAQKEKEKPPLRPTFDIYGYVMTDMGHQFNENDPFWFDVLRPTKLPAFHDEFGEGGRWFASVRQTRFGVKAHMPTKRERDTIQTIFEWELFGVGEEAGETIFRLRHAYGEWRNFGAGQTWSVFMDPDVFPNSLEYWGPPGMVFFRNVQARWIAHQGGLPSASWPSSGPAHRPTRATSRTLSSSRTSAAVSRSPTSPRRAAWPGAGDTSNSRESCGT